jgi:hypothetical protein
MTASLNYDQLLADLEDSIPQGVANDTSHRPRTYDILGDDQEDDVLDSLDALLNDSLRTVEQQAQYKKDLAARKRGFVGMSKDEVDFCNSRIQAFEMAREWQADAAIAVFQRFTCANCLDTRTIFSRYMEHHQHRRNPTSKRWLTVAKPEGHLPVEAVVEQRPVPLCVSCAPKAGLDTHTMRDLKEVLK